MLQKNCYKRIINRVLVSLLFASRGEKIFFFFLYYAHFLSNFGVILINGLDKVNFGEDMILWDFLFGFKNLC
jgi:hypothetical protein